MSRRERDCWRCVWDRWGRLAIGTGIVGHGFAGEVVGKAESGQAGVGGRKD